MLVTVDSHHPKQAKVDLLVLPMLQVDPEKWRLPPRLAAVDKAIGGGLAAILSSGDFRGKSGQRALVYSNGGVPAKRLLLVGLGKAESLDSEAFRRAAGSAVGEAIRLEAKSVAVAVPRTRPVSLEAAAQALAEGGVLARYRFDSYKQKSKAKNHPTALSLSVERAADTRPARAAAKVGVAIAESQNVARQLSNEPPNALPPLALAKAASRVAKEVGLKCRVLDVPEMKKRKMGAILAVGQGSVNPPRLVILEHNAPARGSSGGRKGGTAKGRRLPTICLVGKGVTFDSGGISIKPAAAMDEMKHDMSGAATVVGALRACALLKLPLHVVGVIGAAENLPSGTAYRPGDILTSMSKKTIEILNTDAEGRVVLADALHFARTEFDPVAMVDVATLTGAIVIALGSHASGMFGNDERLVDHLKQAGETSGERLWAMPLWEGHRKAVESAVADVKNVAGREASSSTAAAFLAAFADETPWVHLDIAATGWSSKTGPYQPRGATGVGVRLLVEALQTWKKSNIV
jgi:leucyl aminopeptidase